MEKAVFRRIGCTIYQGSTSHGLKYIICPVKGCKKVTCGIIVNKGGTPDEESIDGTRIPAGTAHFLEHRLFQMEEGDGGDILASLGCYSNAVTDTSSTTYYFSSTSDGKWEEGLEVLAKMCTTFYMSDDDVDRERQIILRERERTLDDPSRVMMDTLLRAMYFNSPIKEEIIGTPESLSSIHTSALRKFFRRHYTIRNMVLVALGDLDPVKTAAKIEKLKLYNGFSALDALPLKRPDEDRTRVKDAEAEAQSPDGQTYLGVGIKFPSREALYTKYGDLLFALYEILPNLVFSSILKPIDKARKEGLIIFSEPAFIEQSGEDACLLAMFETNAPRKLKAALEKHLTNPCAAISLSGKELRATKLAYLGEASQIIENPESLLEEMISGYENHVAWPALASRAVTIGSRDALNLLKELGSWPRSYAILRGKGEAS